MPDISMCENISCPLKESCYRYTATPDEYRQTYGEFEYKIVDGVAICKYKIEINE
jgi:hypothetical protein